MSSWKSHAVRSGVLCLLLILSACLPGTGAGRPATPPPPADPGLIAEIPPPAEDDALPRPTAAPSTTPGASARAARPVAHLVPTGPVTYVPILMYHYIRVNPNPRDRVGFGLSTPPAMFHAQMQYLADHGFRVISLRQAVAAIRAHSPLPSRPVVLTFDDGYADFFSAAIPELRSHGFTATNFVISGRMGMWSYMTPGQVAAAAAMGFNIGAHTVDHFALAALAPARAIWEMRTSKQTLEGLLGQPVLDFAYPYGSYTAFVAAQARTLGFETAASSNPGVLHWAGQLMYLSRQRVGGGMSLRTYASLLAGPAPTAAEIALAGQPVTASTGPASPSPVPSPATSPSLLPSPSATVQ